MHADASLSDTMQLRFPSTLSEVDNACDKVQHFLAGKRQVCDHFLILLALREALTNAVLHGNRNNADMSVACQVTVSAEQVEVVVRDQGNGFAWRMHDWELPRPDEESGRGLAIIKTCFGQISFNEPGNEITLRKRLDPTGGMCMSEIVQDGRKATVVVKDDLVGSRIESVRQELLDLMNQGVVTVVIDLDGVQTVDSLGMGLLVATHNSLKAKQGQLALINVNAKIFNVLSIMRLDKHFSISKAQ